MDFTASFGGGSEDGRRFATEGKVVSLATEVIEGRGNPLKVQKLVKSLLKDHPRGSTEDDLVWMSMRRIVGLNLNEISRPQHEGISLGSDQQIFNTVAWAWACWASGENTKKALAEIKNLNLAKQRGQVIHFLALTNWAGGVQALLRKNYSEAKRLYKRAIEVGGSFGTETNPAICWTYVASFFPQKEEAQNLSESQPIE